MASPSPLSPAVAPMGESAADHPWERTGLGARESWPPCLAFAAELTMRSPLATALYWGPQRLLIHNEAWARLVGGQAAQGTPAAALTNSLWPLVRRWSTRWRRRAEAPSWRSNRSA